MNAHVDLRPPHAGAKAGTLSRILDGLRHPSLPRLFRQRVIKGGEDECWPWDGMVKDSGHGRFQLRTGVNVSAARLAYYIHHGRWPGDLYVCHSCDNPGCVNPKHLWLGTTQENTADMVAKGRALRPIGELASRSKLTAEQVLDIRRRFVPGRKGNRAALVKEFGVSTTSLWAILRRRTWQHI